MVEDIQGQLNKQFDVIVCDILNKQINFPTPWLPLKVVYDEKPNICGTHSLIILSSKDLLNLVRANFQW